MKTVPRNVFQRRAGDLRRECPTRCIRRGEDFTTIGQHKKAAIEIPNATHHAGTGDLVLPRLSIGRNVKGPALRPGYESSRAKGYAAQMMGLTRPFGLPI